MQQAEDLSKRIGRKAACAALGIPRSSQYRARRLCREPTPRKNSPRALRPAEKEVIRQELNMLFVFSQKQAYMIAGLLPFNMLFQLAESKVLRNSQIDS